MPIDAHLALYPFALTLFLWTARRLISSQNRLNIRGPKAASWIYGNMPQFLLSREYGEHEFQWQESYGPESRLMISDPITVKHILNSPVFVWGPTHRKVANVLFGYGNIFLAQGAVQPMSLADRWEFLGVPGNTVDISRLVGDAALDVIAILECSFNAQGGKSELSGVQRTLIDSVSSLTKFALLIDAVLRYIPDPILRLASTLPTSGTEFLQKYKRLTDDLARDLVRQKRDTEGFGIDQTFISQFIRPDDSDGNVGVPDEEIPVHLRTILFAGSDTTASTVGWILYRLAGMKDFQSELRTEIQLGSVNEPDYDKMPLLNAMINEALRLYSPLPFVDRVATEDYVLPLSQPILTTNGVRIYELPIGKGQRLHISIAAYHRLASIWGPDAREFRPSRWLESEPCKGPALGPHASLLTFLGGPTVCLGQVSSALLSPPMHADAFLAGGLRTSSFPPEMRILEIQVLVVELVRKFVLTLPEDDSVRPHLATTMVSRTADDVQQLPIHVETAV
ncbi:cytochrome P450 [Mycena latifolia]|nr:cytochrome P450 [Mycena latifolia]